MKINFFTIILSILVSSCSGSKSFQLGTELNTVPIVEESKSKTQIILNKDEKSINNELEKTNERHKNFGLFFGPGVNRTISYTTFIDQLESSEINFDLVSGIGMGAVFAVLYSSGVKSSRIEWIFFKFLQESRNVKLFSDEWINLVEKNFFPYIKYKDLNQLPIKTYIPLFDQFTRKIKFVSRGSIRDILHMNLILTPKKSLKYISSLAYLEDPEEYLRFLGADFIISLNSLGNNIKFDYPNHFLSGFFGKIVSRKKASIGGLYYLISFPMQELSLDGRNEISSLMNKNKNIAKKEINYIKENKEQWLKSNDEN